MAFTMLEPLYPREFKRKLTKEYVVQAIDVLNSYLSYNQISRETYEQAEMEIMSAPHDDAISNIMTRVRKKIKW